MTTDTFFVLLVAALVVGIALSIWKGRDRSRYAIGAVLVVAGVFAVLAHVRQGRRVDAIENERDELKTRLAVRDEQVRRACRRAVNQLHSMELKLQSPIGDEFDMAGSLMYFGEPLFAMCGVETDPMAGVGEKDTAKQIARLRSLRETLQHWETD